MKTLISTPVTKEEYWELFTLGTKLPKTKYKVPEYQIASQQAYRLYIQVTIQQREWSFWYTNKHNTIEAFRNINPLHFKFSYSDYWKKIELGEFDRNATEYLPYGLNFLAQAAEMVGKKYKVRRSRGNVMEDVTKSLGLDVYAPKHWLRVV